MICFKALLIFLTILVARSTQVSAKTILILTLLFEMSVMTTMAYIVDRQAQTNPRVTEVEGSASNVNTEQRKGKPCEKRKQMFHPG